VAQRDPDTLVPLSEMFIGNAAYPARGSTIPLNLAKITPLGWHTTTPQPLCSVLNKDGGSYTLLTWPLASPGVAVQGHITIFPCLYDCNPDNADGPSFSPELNFGTNLSIYWDEKAKSIVLLGGKDWGKLSDYARSHTQYKRSNLPRHLWNYLVIVVDVLGGRFVYKTQPFRKLSNRQWRNVRNKPDKNCIEIGVFEYRDMVHVNDNLTRDVNAFLPFSAVYGSLTCPSSPGLPLPAPQPIPGTTPNAVSAAPGSPCVSSPSTVSCDDDASPPCSTATSQPPLSPSTCSSDEGIAPSFPSLSSSDSDIWDFLQDDSQTYFSNFLGLDGLQ